MGPIGPVGPGAAGTPTSLSRFEAVTTANATAQAMSASYANILEIAATDVFANVGGFTIATVSNITTVTFPNSGLFKITCPCKSRDRRKRSRAALHAGQRAPQWRGRA